MSNPATVLHTLVLSLRSDYSGRVSTLSYKVELDDGTLAIAPTTPGVGIVEQAFNSVTATAQYYVRRSDWVSSWSGITTWYESVSGLVYTVPFGPQQSNLVTLILTDATAGNQSVAGSLGWLISLTNEAIATFTVTDTQPTASSFIVTISGATFQGSTGVQAQLAKFVGAATANRSIAQVVTACTVLNSATARLTFAAPFPIAPTNGDAGILF